MIGRAMLATGWESVYEDERWLRPPEALIYVGGLHADELNYCMGAFAGYPLTADRMRAFPVADLDEFRRWVAESANVVQRSAASSQMDRELAAALARGLDANVPDLPCAATATENLDRDGLIRWLADREEVLLLSPGGVSWWFHNQSPPLFISFEGRVIRPPDNVLFVPFNPPWFYPEEVLPRPRDDRFITEADMPSQWDIGAWWYDTGNFGSVGLVVRTIAEVWGVDVEAVVRRMEPLHVTDTEDLRPVLPTEDGRGVRTAAIWMRKPG